MSTLVEKGCLRFAETQDDDGARGREIIKKVAEIRLAMSRLGFQPTVGKSSGRDSDADYEWKQEFQVKGSEIGSLVVFYYPNLD